MCKRQYWRLVFLNFFWLTCGEAQTAEGQLPLYFACFCVFFSFKRTDEQGNPLCILRVFVFFLKTRGHTTNILHVFLCFFLFLDFFFGHKSDRGKHLMCFVCFCVFSYRSQVTRPMYFACFCVFSWDLRTHNQHPPCFFLFLCFFVYKLLLWS